MKIIQYLDRDDYTLVPAGGDDTEFQVWSDLTQRNYYGTSLERARSNRDSAERVKRDHQRKGGE